MLSSLGRLFVRSSALSRSYQLSSRFLQTSVQCSQQERRVADGLSYDELQKRIHSKDIYLVDVRRSDEVAEGRIPGDRWVHIPWEEVGEAFSIPDDEFLTRYGSERPSADEKIVFYCRAGVRSTWALEAHERTDCRCEATHLTVGWRGWVQELNS